MDRGFTFKLISNLINMITATDSKVGAAAASQTAGPEPGRVPIYTACGCALMRLTFCCNRQVLCELKFEFLREVCNHEHYIPLSLPLPSARIAGRNPPPARRRPRLSARSATVTRRLTVTLIHLITPCSPLPVISLPVPPYQIMRLQSHKVPMVNMFCPCVSVSAL